MCRWRTRYRWYLRKTVELRLLAILFISVYSSILVGQSCADLTGHWINELGSLLVIDKIETDGSITGEYRSSTGVDGQVFPLMGWVNNYSGEEPKVPSIAFSVRWEGYNSITSWTGSCDSDSDGPRIKTLWNLVRPEQEFEWERIISNSSTFRPHKK